MTVYKPKAGVTFRYDFEYRGRRYLGNTRQTTRQDAEAVEAEKKRRLRLQAGGIDVPGREDSPRIQDWAEVFFEYKSKRLARPEALGDILPVALGFWGAPDDVEPNDDHPCHDLRLVDPIADPDWILKFEAWLERRGLGPQSKNHYRGLLRRMYAVALLPEYRKRTGVATNPFAGVPNDPTMARDVTVTPKQLRAWLTHASYHVRLAVAIGALASKLRLRNILELQWARDFDPDPRTTKFNPRTVHYITVARHKTARRTRRPLVAPISTQLLRILKDAWKRQPGSGQVVTYRGEPVSDIRGGVKAAVEAAALPYGRDRADGITFHTLRHTATTLMAEQLGDPMKLMDAAGHTDLATTMRYRHTRPRHQKPIIEGLSRLLKIEDVVTAAPLRVRRKTKTA